MCYLATMESNKHVPKCYLDKCEGKELGTQVVTFEEEKHKLNACKELAARKSSVSSVAHGEHKNKK